MNKDKLTVEENPSKDSEGRLCNFEDLFQMARGMKKFEKFSDRDLKKTLISHFFTNDNENSSENLEIANQILSSKQLNTIDSSNTKSSNINHYKLLKNPIDEFRLQIITRKSQYLSNINEDLIPITDVSLVNALFVKLTKDIQAYHNGNAWDYQTYLTREFKTFLSKLANAVYLAETQFPLKIWHMITGKKKTKINQCDPLLHISLFPALKWEPIYGNSYFQAKTGHDPWFTLLYGISGIKQSQISIENSHYYSCNKLLLNVSLVFDEIFALASFLSKDNNKELRSDDLFYKHISESFLPALKIFKVIDHVSNNISQSSNHPLYTHHLIYLISWSYLRWINILEKALTDKRNYDTNDGQTGEISLKEIFNEIQDKINQELNNQDLEKTIGESSLTPVEIEALLNKIDFYSQIIPEIKKRLKNLLSYLLGDVISHYLLQKKLQLTFHIDDKGDLIFDNLIKVKSTSKNISSSTETSKQPTRSSQNKQDSVSHSNNKKIYEPSPISESDEDSKPSSIPQSNNKEDYIGYSSTLGDFIIVLTSLSVALNENFERDNHFRISRVMNQERYDYLRSNEYFRSRSEEFDFEQIMKIQDCYDLIFYTKKVAIQVDQAIKNDVNVEDIGLNFKRTKESLEKLALLFKETFDDLKSLSQNPEKTEKYSGLLKKFNLIYTEFIKPN